MEGMYKVCDVKLTYNTKVKSSERAVVRDSNSTYSLLMDHIYDSQTIQYKEYMKLILLNRAHKVLGIVHISEGGLDSTSADIRIIMQAAILGNSSAMILSHNHPSGNKQPSNQDDLLTDRVKKAAKLFDIQLLDHIIVTDSGYYSYSNEGRLL
ncbi:MAG: JAB domain-containing protein [Parabacteroides sp.]|nr:JAB domain-containing protein [Parabacteroides sp.]